MRKIRFPDHLEEGIATALNEAGIEFIHESQNKAQGLDFYLPAYDVYIEVKQFHSDRISRQMELDDNVIAIQGAKAVDFFVHTLKQTVKK